MFCCIFLIFVQRKLVDNAAIPSSPEDSIHQNAIGKHMHVGAAPKHLVPALAQKRSGVTGFCSRGRRFDPLAFVCVQSKDGDSACKPTHARPSGMVAFARGMSA